MEDYIKTLDLEALEKLYDEIDNEIYFQKRAKEKYRVIKKIENELDEINNLIIHYFIHIEATRYYESYGKINLINDLKFR